MNSFVGPDVELVGEAVGPTEAGVGIQLGEVEDGVVVDEDVGDPAGLTLLRPPPSRGQAEGQERNGEDCQRERKTHAVGWRATGGISPEPRRDLLDPPSLRCRLLGGGGP